MLLTKALIALGAAEAVAVGGVLIVGMAPQCASTRRALLRQAKNVIENRNFKAGTPEATLDALALREIKRLRRSAKDGWHTLEEARAFKIILEQCAVPMTEQFVRSTYESATAELKKAFEEVLRWPKTAPAAA